MSPVSVCVPHPQADKIPSYQPPKCDYAPKPCGHAAGYHQPTAGRSEMAGFLGLKVDNRTSAFVWPAPEDFTKVRAIPVTTREKIAACAALGLSYWANHPTPSTVWAVDDYQQPHSVHIDRKAGKAEHRCSRYSQYQDDSKKCPESGRRETFTVVNTLEELALQLDPVQGRIERMVARAQAEREANPFPGPAPRLGTTMSADKAEKAMADALNHPQSAANKSRRRPAPKKTLEQNIAEIDARIDAHNAPPRYDRPTGPSMTTEAAIELIAHDPEFFDDHSNEDLVAVLTSPLRDPRHDAAITAELKARGLTPVADHDAVIAEFQPNPEGDVA